MKRILLITVVSALLFFCECKAEGDTLVINLKNNKVEQIAISQIQSIKFENIPSSVNEQKQLANGLIVKGNYPNPFGEQTSIEFEIATFGDVQIQIYDDIGNQIQTLNCQNCRAGKNTVVWNCLDKNNNRIQSGVYFYEVHFGKELQTKKMIIVR